MNELFERGFLSINFPTCIDSFKENDSLSIYKTWAIYSFILKCISFASSYFNMIDKRYMVKRPYKIIKANLYLKSIHYNKSDWFQMLYKNKNLLFFKLKL